MINEVEVKLPIGSEITLKITDFELNNGFSKCCVIKDAGDDPDITDKAKICAEVKKIEKGIIIKGGWGVGKVTKPGLQIAVGEPAINPIPRKMILEEVSKVLPPNQGAEVTIFVPGGEELAKKTFNPKLGIVGGISILGTTGIVEPMSEEAFKESLVPQIDIALANGYDEIILTPGNIGEKIAISKGVPSEAIIQMGNFVGFMLEACVRKGIRKALLVGHISKLTKIAAGIFNTHAKVADARFETLAAYASLLGAEKKIIKSILESNTTEHALEILQENNLTKVFDLIAERASVRSMEYIDKKMEIGAILFSYQREIIGKSSNAVKSKWAKFLL